MKNLSLFISAFTLCASTSYAAIDCASLPNCGDLGYSDTVAECPKSVNGEEMVIRCPFDAGKADKEAKGKCIYEAAVGQIAYFTKAPDAASGWLLCDGKSYPYAKYPQLASRIGTQFGGTKDNTFNVPDYRGFFLRVYADGTCASCVRSDFTTYSGNTNYSLTTPQKEELPNITGTFTVDDEGYTNSVGYYFNIGKPTTKLTDFSKCTSSSPCQNRYVSGAFSFYNRSKDSEGYINPKGPGGDGGGIFAQFQAKHSNAIYGGSHVIPANMAVYAYIYAGKIVQ